MTRRLLAIESATDWLSVALLEGEALRALGRADDARQHASQLMPLVARTLDEAGWSVDDLDALAVSAGPGSFTSLRIGLATAKGLAFGRDWQAVAVSTLEAMALSVLADRSLAEGTVVLTLLDARRGEWYAGAWKRGGSASSDLEPILAEGLYAPDELVADLAKAGAREPVVVAPEPGGWRRAFEPAGLALARVVEGPPARPRADWVAHLGALRIARGEAGPPAELAARYLRRAEAEARRLGGPVEAGELARVAPGPGKQASALEKGRVISRS